MSILDKRYFNIEITNLNELVKLAAFDTHLAQPLLDKPSDYCMVVQKFSMDTEGIPVSVIELKQPQTPKTQDWETIHNVYMVDTNGNVASANVLFNTTPLKNIPPVPVKIESGLAYYNNKLPYFFVYHYRTI